MVVHDLPFPAKHSYRSLRGMTKAPLTIPETVRGATSCRQSAAVSVDARLQRLATTSGRRPGSSGRRDALEDRQDRATASEGQEANSVHVEHAHKISTDPGERRLCRSRNGPLSRRLPERTSPDTHSFLSFLSIGRRSCK